uniref:Uncharacterized protein n=1 Tax=Noccaea caerulescens TaxID=107243 RepID=A0A1J3G2N4_NOCCA
MKLMKEEHTGDDNMAKEEIKDLKEEASSMKEEMTNMKEEMAGMKVDLQESEKQHLAQVVNVLEVNTVCCWLVLCDGNSLELPISLFSCSKICGLLLLSKLSLSLSWFFGDLFSNSINFFYTICR